jgi:uncharacterized protein (TIGR02270 family)
MSAHEKLRANGMRLISTADRTSVLPIVEQHLEDVVVLHGNREVLLSSGHTSLLNLLRIDERLAAHLDGLNIARDQGWRLCEAALEVPSRGALFAATVCAIGDKRRDRLERLFSLAQSDRDACSGLSAAFGWVDPAELRGLVVELLASEQSFRKSISVVASAMHRVDPGLDAMRLLEHADPLVRARAFRTAGELGKRELVSALTRSITDDDPHCQFWAAWSAVLLGDRSAALEFLKAIAPNCAISPRAWQLVLQTLPVSEAHEVLKPIAQSAEHIRAVIKGRGLCGDPTCVPWLIAYMADDKLARLAGEAFSMITGLDLALVDLERKPPEGLEDGPNDDPEDPNVEMDEDEGLPWPDQARIQALWKASSARFAGGVRHFMGAPPSRAHCIDVLKNGYQRQRIAAAYHICLLNPGTPLFEWRAPAWRQQRELAQMS